MIILATFVEAVAQILHMVINLYIWIVIISALISFVRPDPYNPLVQILYRDWETDRKSTRLNSSHSAKSRMPSSA